MKKFAAIFAAAVLTITLAACINGDITTASDGSSGTETAEIL